MAAVSHYLRPDRLMTLDATVTGTVAESYEAAWLCDGRLQYPVRGPAASGSPASASLSLSIAGTSRLCGLAVLANHNLDDDVDATLSNGITATLKGGSGDRPNQIPWNRWVSFTPVMADGCDLSVSGNSQDVIIGELLIGQRFDLSDAPLINLSHELPQYAIPLGAEFAAGNGYDKGMAGGRLLEFGYIVEDDDLEDAVDGLRAWEEACRNGTLPSALVPDNSKPEVYVGTIVGFQWEQIGAGLNQVRVLFQEHPRTRW